jgi:SPP1 family predicted phage head-tail adaptor
MPALNHRITLRQQQAGTDDHGQPNGAWADVASVWADVLWPTGMAAYRERIMANADVADVACSVMIRRRADVTPGMRVLHNGMDLDITGIMPSNVARDMMFLMCQRVQ